MFHSGMTWQEMSKAFADQRRRDLATAIAWRNHWQNEVDKIEASIAKLETKD